MKIIVTKELKSRLYNASVNGSIVATEVLKQINSKADASQVISGISNYFATKRKSNYTDAFTKMRVVFTACSKDLTNEHFPDKDNPQAPWFKENRTELEPSTFVSYFKTLPEYSSEELEYFGSAICVDSKVKVSLCHKMVDFERAYCGDNYSPVAQFSESTLHNSCMRYENTTRSAADFYCNFAGAKIIIATDSANNILGRAIVWEKAIFNQDDMDFTVSVLDRVYYTHSFVLKMIHKYAEKIGINLRKVHNDYAHTKEFFVLNPVSGLEFQPGEQVCLTLKIKPILSKCHKNGVPYLDTFCRLIITPNVGLELINNESDYAFASCQSTGGTAVRIKNVCPKCGCLHKDMDVFCTECLEELTELTPVGRILVGKTHKFNGQSYPAVLFHKGRPKPEFSLYIQANKFF